METRLAASARLLVVEPDAALRKLLSEALSEAGWAPWCAATVEEALALVDHRAFDCIITDDTRVGTAQDPLCVARALRQRAQPTPMGVLTAWNLTLEGGGDQGLAFVLPKPFDLDQLLAQVAVALGAPQAPEAHHPEAGSAACLGGASGAPALEPAVR